MARMPVRERNRKIKSALAKVFGAKNVSVRGGRGTAYGWVEIKIKSKKPYDAIHRVVWDILRRTGLEKQLDYYYDDDGRKRPAVIIEVIR